MCQGAAHSCAASGLWAQSCVGLVAAGVRSGQPLQPGSPGTAPPSLVLGRTPRGSVHPGPVLCAGPQAAGLFAQRASGPASTWWARAACPWWGGEGLQRFPGMPLVSHTQPRPQPLAPSQCKVWPCRDTAGRRDPCGAKGTRKGEGTCQICPPHLGDDSPAGNEGTFRGSRPPGLELGSAPLPGIAAPQAPSVTRFFHSACSAGRRAD